MSISVAAPAFSAIPRYGSDSVCGVASPGWDTAGAAPALVPEPVAEAPIVMIGVPTATVWPSSTMSACTVPANGEGSSTSDLAVSISTTTSLTLMTSPTLTFQVTISASVSPSPTSGSLYSGTKTLLWSAELSVGQRPV